MINGCNDGRTRLEYTAPSSKPQRLFCQTATVCRSACTGSRVCFPCVCVCLCVRGMSHTVWEQALPQYRKDIRNNMSVGGRGRETDRGGFQGKEETKGEHPQVFILTTKPLPLSLPHPPPSPPPTSAKCPSSTISALQRGTTTNSASLTRHGKHSCLSAFACRPLIPASSSRT